MGQMGRRPGVGASGGDICRDGSLRADSADSGHGGDGWPGNILRLRSVWNLLGAKGCRWTGSSGDAEAQNPPAATVRAGFLRSLLAGQADWPGQRPHGT